MRHPMVKLYAKTDEFSHGIGHSGQTFFARSLTQIDLKRQVICLD
jgi:hypothetical protein